MRLEKFLFGENYHIYNRGNSKKEIFHDKEDYERFQKLLYICNSSKKINFRDDIVKRKIDAYDFETDKKLVNIYTYVLMPNHFHLCLSPTALNLVEGSGDGEGNLYKFMMKLLGSYSRYYNKKYKRTGTLFEGTFKAKHIETNNQLKYLFSYIHLNPLKLIQKNWKEVGVKDLAKAKVFINTFCYSSYLDYLDKNSRVESKILVFDFYKKILNNKREMQEEIFSWLELEV